MSSPDFRTIFSMGVDWQSASGRLRTEPVTTLRLALPCLLKSYADVPTAKLPSMSACASVSARDTLISAEDSTFVRQDSVSFPFDGEKARSRTGNFATRHSFG